MSTVLCLAVLLAALGTGHAQQARSPASVQADLEGPSWASLTPTQRAALAPLQNDWGSIDAARKQKWLNIAARMPSMPPAERERIQARMHEWTKMSPQERGQTRLRYQEARQVNPTERQQRWQAYQSLPPEKRQALAARAQPQAKPSAPTKGSDRGFRQNLSQPTAKSNIVPNPAFADQPKAIGPSVVQAKPGATTTLISRPPSPPRHQQTGLPKIAATPDFVDRRTLLPQKGPQGAAALAAPTASSSRP